MLSWLKKIFPKEFSQKLACIVTIVWVLSIIASFICTGFGISILAVLDYVQTAFLGVLGGYFTKAGLENIKKIVTPSNDNNNESV